MESERLFASCSLNQFPPSVPPSVEQLISSVSLQLTSMILRHSRRANSRNEHNIRQFQQTIIFIRLCNNTKKNIRSPISSLCESVICAVGSSNAIDTSAIRSVNCNYLNIIFFRPFHHQDYCYIHKLHLFEMWHLSVPPFYFYNVIGYIFRQFQYIPLLLF